MNFTRPWKNKTYEQRYGIKRAKEIRLKLSLAKRGKRMSKKNRQAISLVTKGISYIQKYGAKRAKEERLKRSIAHMGKIKSKLHKKHLSNAIRLGYKNGRMVWNKGKSNPTFLKLNRNKNFQKKRKLGLKQRPTKLEKLIITLSKKHKIPLRYVGNRKLWIKEPHSRKRGYNPDFISKNKKVILEVFGKYWHEKKGAQNRDNIKLKLFKRLGYKVIIVWDYELLKQNEKEIIKKLKKIKDY